MATKLPRGLREFEGSLGDQRFAPELVKRLLNLPENNFSQWVGKYDKAAKRVREAEQTLVTARVEAYKSAMMVWNLAKQNYSVAELQEATGYDEE